MELAIFLGGSKDRTCMSFPGELDLIYINPTKAGPERYFLQMFATRHGDINAYIYDGVLTREDRGL